MKLLVVVAGAAVIGAALLAVAAVPLALALPATLAVVGAPIGGGSTAGEQGSAGSIGDLPGHPGAVASPPVPAGAAVADVPAGMLALYLADAGRCPGLPWTVLTAIGKVETDHGRGGELSPAGAEGPMQFMPATWAAYGVDGDGDGVASVWDPADAVAAAADYLCANGGGDPAHLTGAIFNYNHDDSYVRLVLAWAADYSAAALHATPA